MLKSLLVACALSPCLLSAPELQAQSTPGISNFGAGGLSGGGKQNPFTNPQVNSNVNVNVNVNVTVTPDVLASFLALQSDIQGGGFSDLDSLNPSLFNDPRTVTVTTFDRDSITFSTIEVIVGGKTTSVVIETPAAAAAGTVAERNERAAGTDRAVTAAKAMLLAGGTPSQAKLAARLGLAGVELSLIGPFIKNITILLQSVLVSSSESSSTSASSPSKLFVSSLGTKSLDLGKSVIAQKSDSDPKLTLNVKALVSSIETYNIIIDKSDAKTVEKISKDERLNKINESLTNLRAIFKD